MQGGARVPPGSATYGLVIDYNLWLGVPSYPGPQRGGGERAWYTLHAPVLGTPEKCGVIGYYCILSIYRP